MSATIRQRGRVGLKMPADAADDAPPSLKLSDECRNDGVGYVQLTHSLTVSSHFISLYQFKFQPPGRRYLQVIILFTCSLRLVSSLPSFLQYFQPLVLLVHIDTQSDIAYPVNDPYRAI